MFTEEDKHRLIEHMNIAEARLLSTFTFVMQDIYRQIISSDNHPSGYGKKDQYPRHT